MKSFISFSQNCSRPQNILGTVGLLGLILCLTLPLASNANVGKPKSFPSILAPACISDWNVQANKSTVTISTQMTLGNTSGPVTNLLDGVAGTVNTNSAWLATSPTQPIANKEVFKFVFPQPTILNGFEITRSFFIANNATYKIQGSNDGSMWTDITATQTFSSASSAAAYGAPEVSWKFPFAGNTNAYSQYRIFGVSGNTANNWVSEFYFGTVAKTAGLSSIAHSYGANLTNSSDDQITFNLNPTGGTGSYNVSVSAGSVTPTTGTFGSSTAFTLQPGSAGAGNVTLTITDVALNCDFTEVVTDPGIEPYDTDGDGVNNKVDLDDDNDGILDTVENASCAAVDYNTNLTNKAKLKVSTTATVTGDINVILDGNVTNNSFYYTGTAQAVANKTYLQVEFPKPTLLKGLELAAGAWIFANGAVLKVQGSNDGSTWADLLTSTRTQAEPACSYGTCTIAETFDFPTNNTAYKSYRLFGVSGTSRQFPWVNELFVKTAPLTLCDFDGDGIANSLDLDTDNDGIPDNVEAQATLTYVAPSADNNATYATNNGVNSAYLAGITPLDTDNDGLQDICDLDSDNDLDTDKLESGLTFNGVPGLNGLDSGSETADTYADANGIVNDPKNVLASTKPGVGEVKYREIPPLKRTITVCYKSGLQYGIGGQYRTAAGGQLLNPVNFSLTGTSTFTFKLVPFTTAFTKTGLEAQGCQIVDLGTTNSDGLTTSVSYTDTEENELIAWSAASRSNVILAFQGYANRLGGSGFVAAGGNTDPNALTTLGQKVISGPFGTVASFNQGGGVTGNFSQLPASACTIVEDNSNPKRATGVIDKITGDVYLADVDLITELGGLSAANTITTNTDKFFANLYHSLAKMVVYAPEDPCTFFSCAAGQNAPTLSVSSISGTGSVNLTGITASNLPANTALTWHTGTPATTANKISNPAAYSTGGVIFASFYDSASDCYAGSGTTTTPLTVTVITASPQADLSVSVAPATQTGNKGESLTYIVTLTNAGPATATNVVVDVPMPDPKAMLLSSTATAGSYNSVTKEWTVPSLAVGSATLTFTVKVN